jgi:hypothetical protein
MLVTFDKAKLPPLRAWLAALQRELWAAREVFLAAGLDVQPVLDEYKAHCYCHMMFHAAPPKHCSRTAVPCWLERSVDV